MESAFGVELGKALTGTPGDKRNTKYAASALLGAQVGGALTHGSTLGTTIGAGLGTASYKTHRNSIRGAKQIQDSRRAAHKRKTETIPQAKAIREADVSKRGIFRSARGAAQNAEKITGDVAQVTDKVKTLIPGRRAAIAGAAGGIAALGAANGGATYLGARQGTKSAMKRKPPKSEQAKRYGGPLNLDELDKAFDPEQRRHLRNDVAAGAAAGGSIALADQGRRQYRNGRENARQAGLSVQEAATKYESAASRSRKLESGKVTGGAAKSVGTAMQRDVRAAKNHTNDAARALTSARKLKTRGAVLGAGATALAGGAAGLAARDRRGAGRTYSYR